MKKNYILFNMSTYKYFLYSLILLCSFSIHAQVINFTIDTATDNATDIVETISTGGDTYVLIVSHPGDEELGDLGGGDLIFYLSTGGPTGALPFSLSLTKNGTPTNFKLNSIGYDTLGPGGISVTNQDNAEIAANMNYATGAGSIVFTNTANAANITSFNIIPSATGVFNDFGFHNINIEVLNTLSTENFTLDNAFTVTPNPSNGLITIGNSGIALDKVQVSDLNGRVVATHNLNGMTESKTLNLSSVLSSGMYLMTLTSNEASTVKKLIIK